jgi:hypothetical protein
MKVHRSNLVLDYFEIVVAKFQKVFLLDVIERERINSFEEIKRLFLE